MFGNPGSTELAFLWIPAVLLGGLLLAVGGLPMFLWGGCLHTVIGMHGT